MAERQGRKAGGLRAFAAENGMLLLASKVLGGALRRVRDALLASKLRTTGFRLGRSPRLLGLGHMRIGANFAGGNDLWLEAVTSFAGEALEPMLTIGADCNVSDAVHIGCAHRVTIGDGFLCGSRVLIIDHGHGSYGSGYGAGDGSGSSAGGEPADPLVRPNLRKLSSGGRVVIGNNVWVGDGCVILAGAQIGDGAVIGANSVVTGMVPARVVAAGAPVRVLRRWDASTGDWLREPS